VPISVWAPATGLPSGNSFLECMSRAQNRLMTQEDWPADCNIFLMYEFTGKNSFLPLII
jgi:hypothetical protein